MKNRRITHYNEKEQYYDVKKAYLCDIHDDGEAWVNTYNAYQKLGELEDIEDELGIDLVTFFKALKNGIYCKIENKIEHISAPYLNWHCKKIYICDICNLNDYGKTWALTKKELENEIH